MGRHSSGNDGMSDDEFAGRRVESTPASQNPPTDDDFGFERDRSSSGRRGWLWGLLGLIIVAVLVSGFLVWRTVSGGCGDRTAIAVASDPAMADTVRTVASTASENSCYDYTVTEVAGADVPGLLTKGDASPALWVADSQVQARRVTSQVRRNPDFVSESIATSPTVVVGKEVGTLGSWVDVMKLSDLRMGSPIDTSTGDAPIVGALAEVESGKLTQKELTDAMTILAVQQNNARLANDSEGARLNLANTSEVPVPVVTTEQQFELFQRTHQGSQLASSVPADGTVMLDYPMVNTAGPAAHDTAADAGTVLADAAASEAGRAALNEAGFRAPDGTGVGQPVTVLTLKDQTKVDKALRQWQVLGVPIRTLVVEDTSGSMEATVGSTGSTRAQLLSNASLAGMKLFPNNTQIGGWAFSINKGGDGQDWVEMAPIRRLDAPGAGGKDHRDELAEAITVGLKDLGGGTGLYDTTLAAFKKVQDTYDPNYSNSVIIMTDGQNEDAGSISLDELLAQLKELEDPARPVLVLTIGISDDADTDALKQIADATGGTTYVAKTADDINSVFVNAIAARVAAAGR